MGRLLLSKRLVRAIAVICFACASAGLSYADGMAVPVWPHVAKQRAEGTPDQREEHVCEHFEERVADFERFDTLVPAIKNLAIREKVKRVGISFYDYLKPQDELDDIMNDVRRIEAEARSATVPSLRENLLKIVATKTDEVKRRKEFVCKDFVGYVVAPLSVADPATSAANLSHEDQEKHVCDQFDSYQENLHRLESSYSALNEPGVKEQVMAEINKLRHLLNEQYLLDKEIADARVIETETLSLFDDSLKRSLLNLSAWIRKDVAERAQFVCSGRSVPGSASDPPSSRNQRQDFIPSFVMGFIGALVLAMFLLSIRLENQGIEREQRVPRYEGEPASRVRLGDEWEMYYSAQRR